MTAPIYDQMPDGAGNNRITFNEAEVTKFPALGGGKRYSTSVGLTLDLVGGVFDVAGTPTVQGNTTFSLPASSLTYVYRDKLGVLHQTTSIPSGWPGPLASGNLAVCDAQTDTATITTFNDWRIAIGSASLATILNALGISAWSFDGTNITITMASNGKQLILGPFE